MDASFPNKRIFDHSTVDRSDHPHLTPTSSTKRRHQHHHPIPSSPATPQSNNNNPFRASLKFSPGETLYRILCPAAKTGGLIGKGGAIIRQFREETGAKIRIDDFTHGSEERVILIVAADSTPKNKDTVNNEDSNSEESGSSSCEDSPAQKALIRVFERILKVDEERSKMSKEESDNGEDNSADGSVGIPQGPVVCRLLAAGNQIGCVLGRGGKIIEKIRQESGAQVRVLPKDQLPECASPGDELIQMAGKFPAVKKALILVSNCLRDNPRPDTPANSGSIRPIGMVPHGYGGEGIGNHHRIPMEEEIIFRLLCQADKAGCLIGKGGSIRRALQSETGASIKISDSPPESDERVVIISARETLEQRHSPSQDAVMRVHGRIFESGYEQGGAIVARLLVHPWQIGCLWGKGGIIISDLRRITGANIHIFPKEHVAKYGMPNDEVVQVIGSLQSVQDALFQITGRLRETFFPVKPYFPMGPYQEIRPPPPFRPRHDHPFEHPPVMHGGDHLGQTYFDRGPYTPPGRWAGGNISESENVNVEIMVPQALLACVYGENNSNLGHIKQISGAKVAVHDGRVVLSGTSDEIHTAQCLLHAFILSEQHLIR